MKNIKQRMIRHYFPMLFLVFVAGLVLFFSWAKRDAITFIAQSTGYISIIILVISLIMGTINLLLKLNNPISTYLRRDVSIIGGVLAVVHSITGLFVHLRGNNWQYFLNRTDKGYSIRLDTFGLANYTGLVSVLVVILLLTISNDYFLRKLNPGKWKNIQRLTYLMFILAIIHCYYYRVVKTDMALFTQLYIPLILVVFFFQMLGLGLRFYAQRRTDSLTQ